MQTQQILETVRDVAQTSNVIVGILESVDPQVAPEAEIAGNLVFLLADLVAKGIAAYAAAADVEITVDAIMKLMPNPVPLTPPTTA